MTTSSSTPNLASGNNWENNHNNEGSHTLNELGEIATFITSYAKQIGASASEAEISQGLGQSITVRLSEIETLEYHQDKSIEITVYDGQKQGHVSTADFSNEAIKISVEKALTIARYTAADSDAGLAEPQFLAKSWPDLDLYHPWPISIEEAIEIAKACEASGLQAGSKITNSEGATVNLQTGQFVYANSNGFVGGYPSSRHSISCSLIAEENGSMQRDYWYSTARHPDDLLAAEKIGRITGERALRRLGARRIPTQTSPVIFEAPIANSLLGHFVNAASGGNLYRHTSFLLNSLHKPIFSPHIQILEQPHLMRGLGSAPFDQEGVTTRNRIVVENGILQGYFLSSYSARKLGLVTTGNAGGYHNLLLQGKTHTMAELLQTMGRGLLVTELLGQGINPVTGDYSRGASGFWVENGAIQYPIEEITIAGNLKSMFQKIVALGDDIDRRSTKQCGSILMEDMTIAGS